MLVHRCIDEKVGKRRISWIAELKRRAVYCIESTPTDQFSSSKGSGFNEAMKQRARDFILPSLFDVAQSHEDYLAQWDLYEGTDKTDSRHGKHVTWERASRPDRKLTRKRRRKTKPSPSPELAEGREDSGEETEVDEHMAGMSTATSSFQSNPAKMDVECEPARAVSPVSPGNMAKVSTPIRSETMPLQHQHPLPMSEPMAPSHGSFDQSISRLYLHEEPEREMKQESFALNQFPGPHPGYGTYGYSRVDGMSGPEAYPFIPGPSPGYYTQQSAQPVPLGLHPAVVPHPYSFPQPQSTYQPMDMSGCYPYPYMPQQAPQVPVPMQPVMAGPEHITHGLPLGYHG